MFGLKSLLFGYDHNELVLFLFLSNKLGFKSACISLANPLRFLVKLIAGQSLVLVPLLSGFQSRLIPEINCPVIRRFVITSSPFLDGLICKSQK